MIPDHLKNRLRKNREMTTVTIRMPVDVIESMKAIAPRKGFSGYQALLKAYVSAGLREDEAEYLYGPTHCMASTLRRGGVDPRLIEEAELEARVA